MGGSESVCCMKRIRRLDSLEEKTLISPNLTIGSSSSYFPSESKGTHSENKNNQQLEKDRSKEECQKPYDEQPEGSYQLEPEFLSCVEQVLPNSLPDTKTLNDAILVCNERVLHKTVSAPAVINGDKQTRSTTGKTSIACKVRGDFNKREEATASCLITDNLSQNLGQCGVDGLQYQKIGQPKIPPRVKKTPVVPPESKEVGDEKKCPATVVEQVPGKSKQKHSADSAPQDPKPESDIENGATPAHHAAVSEKKTTENSMLKAGEASKEGSKESLQNSSIMEVEQCVDSEEDIYRDEEEIKKESINQGTNKCKLGLAPEMKIMQYCNKEWRGQTAVARLMKKGYEAVSQDYCSIRRVRGDNYCALRAFLFQALSQTTELPTWLRDPDFIELPAKLMSKYDWIKHWSPLHSFEQEQAHTQVDTVKEHLELLREKWEMLCKMKIPADKQAACDEIFQNEDQAYNLYEAVKFLMLNKAIDLYNDNLEGKEVPVFSWLLFARSSSSNPQEFMNNHLSQVGHTGGLEQVEMFLLGHAVEHTIKVYRLYKYSTDEFITFYPNDQEDWPVVSLITEDDRHYNVPVGVLHSRELET